MKDQNDPIVSQNEITSLNLADLDVQELENRLELALFNFFASPDSTEAAKEFCLIRGREGRCFIYSSGSSVSSISSN